MRMTVEHGDVCVGCCMAGRQGLQWAGNGVVKGGAGGGCQGLVCSGSQSGGSGGAGVVVNGNKDVVEVRK